MMLIRRRKNRSIEIPLRLVLTVPFVLLTVGTSALVGYLSWQNGQRSIHDLANQLIREVEQRAETHIRSYLETAQLMNANHANAIALNSPNNDQLEQYLCRQLQLYPKVSATHLSDPDGNFIGIVRKPNGQFAVHDRMVATDQAVRAIALNQQCQRGQSLASPGQFDPRDRPWYQAAVRAKQAAWSPIFAWKAAPVIGTNAALPVYDPSGKLRYVLGTSLVLSDISDYLKTLKIGRSGQVFIVERNGLFVASSTAKEPFITDRNQQPQRRSAFEADVPLLKASSVYLQQHNSGFENIDQPQQFITQFDRSTYFLQAIPIVDPRGINWLMIVIVPEADFTQQINANTQTSLLLSLGALIGSILIGLWLTRSIVRPIQHLGRISFALSNGDWKEVQQQSSIAELQVLNRSFQGMADRLQQSFDQTQTRLNDILSSTITAICRFRIDADGRIHYEYFSPSNVVVFGYTAEEFMSDSTLWRSRLHPDDRAQILSNLPPHSDEGAFSTEYRFYHKDGSLRWILDSMRFRRDHNGWIVTGVAIDNTARKQAEQALAESEATKNQILKAIPDLMIWMNADGTCLDVIESDSQPKLYLRLEAIGKNSFQLLPPNLAQARMKAVQHARESGEVIVYEQQFQQFNTVQYEEVRVISVGDRVLVMVRDIGERHRLDRLKTEFISVVSHELRTPLTAIQGCLGLLDTGVYDQRPEKAKRMLHLALINSDRLVRLVNDILDLERLDSGKVELLKEKCSAHDLMQKAVEGISAIADQAGVMLTIQPTEIQIWAAPDMILQTLTNLLSNSIKFSPLNSTVSLSVQTQSDKVQFQVKDQGRGIPADKLETIFGRFQQVDVSDSRQKGGTGLGLAICQTIVQQHGGNIWAESTLEHGSTFYFTLPNSPERRDESANFE